MPNKVLVIVAHPDDETIGMGGTIKKHSNMGDEIFIMSMTDGVGARKNIEEKDVLNRTKLADEASEVLGFKWISRYNFPDNEMDKCSTLEVVQSIEEVKNKYNPSIVYFHSGADLNIDHRVVSNAVLTAFRPQPNENCRELRVFEISSSTDFGHENISGRFIPNLFVNIAETWSSKLSALKIYENEMRLYPHSRSLESIENLAKIRGNQVGIHMAEAFQIIRRIDF